MDIQEAREQLRMGMNTYAFQRGRFVLASGAVSDYYIDIKGISLRGRYLRLIGQILWSMMRDKAPTGVAGLTLGADPLVAIVTATAAAQDYDCPAFIVRKEPKDHGTGKLIEGPVDPKGRQFAIIEDVTTTGSSAMKAAESVIASGGEVLAIYSVLNREAGADKLFADRGWLFESIFTLKDLPL